MFWGLKAKSVCESFAWTKFDWVAFSEDQWDKISFEVETLKQTWVIQPKVC